MEQNILSIQDKTGNKFQINTNRKFIAFLGFAVGGILLLSLIKIDKCLDRGSRWDYESFRCVNIDTSDWQIYRNDEFGFEVRYPRGMNILRFIIVSDMTKKEMRIQR